ncbi:H+/Cl- antiporter ClcA [Thiogranum longum]|uniref:H+/Cl-antiporter ClcA n=1 Tax=Thiogranum longum TaxID=1537524 RepID=A0A4V2PGS6_9GAMM|nr:chloride channel protein [Thiogranum longum]TCK17976.1 H+/Cl- antiporter ClcA [Thiogranum longum]
MSHSIQRWFETFRLQLSRPDAILPFSILGLIAGTLAALTVIALRLLVDYVQVKVLPFDVAENFESISPVWRVGAAVTGGLLIGLLFRVTRKETHSVGVLHVLERLAHHQGRLPWRNALVQFVGGAITMISGHSVGREGPSAHLGAASSNLPAQALRLPNNSLRVLAACGAAAGIAASFNTPLAGAAFAMEVLLMEYSVAGFAPVILATVSATALTRAVFGSDLAYDVPHLSPGALSELPYILVCGVLIGLLAAGFSALFQWVSVQGEKMPAWIRPMLAGLLVGVCGAMVPEVMGIGDDTVNHVLRGELAITLLFVILVVKIIATTGGIGLGLPGGIIGPTLFIGAAAGGLLGAVGAMLGINEASSFGLYAIIGMGAMMAGTLQAPMAGLIAILELTGEPNLILPGMLVVVAATITSGYVGRRESVFQGLLRTRGLDYRNDPAAQSLRRIGVGSVMNRQVVTLPRRVSPAEVDEALAGKPVWILVREAGRADTLLPAVDLVRARRDAPDQESYDLIDVPGERVQTLPVDMGATLQEAQEKMRESGAGALYVISQTVPGIPRVLGVLTAEDIENSYHY